MYKCKIFKGSFIETEMNNFFRKLPSNAKIISIESITMTDGSLSNGYGKLNGECKVLVVWEENDEK